MPADRHRPAGRRASPFARLPDSIWAPASAGTVMLAIGLLGVVAGQPWIFPSLGPTAFMQAEFPEHHTTTFYHTVVGHLVGLAAGFAAVFLLGAANLPPATAGGGILAVRVWAAALSVTLTILGSILLRASHPPAASTTLLVALGGLRATWQEALLLVIGIFMVATLGHVVRALRMPTIELLGEPEGPRRPDSPG